jgi:hypothetical protein
MVSNKVSSLGEIIPKILAQKFQKIGLRIALTVNIGAYMRWLRYDNNILVFVYKWAQMMFNLVPVYVSEKCNHKLVKFQDTRSPIVNC